MANKMSRRISAILVALMLMQCIPGNLIGNLVFKVRAADAGYVSDNDYNNQISINGYSYDIPYESEHNIDVEIPPTYIYEDEDVGISAFDLAVEMRKNSAEIYSVGYSDGMTGDFHKINEPIGAPFLYNAAENEAIDLNSGALIYKTTDYVLPGVNGLDLVIGRRYNSQAANETEEQDISFSYFTGKFYVYLRCTIEYDYFLWDDEEYISYEYYDTYDEAVARVEEWKKLEGEKYYFESKGERGKVISPEGSFGPCMTTDDEMYLNKIWGLGYGWEFCFSSIESVSYQKIGSEYKYGKQYFHPSTGGMYEIDFECDSPTHLKNYDLGDMVFEKDDRTYSNGYRESFYKVTYKDGKREYFDANGQLIAIKDRYDNTIKFVHTKVDGRPQMEITDTLGRVINFTCYEDKTVVSLPDGVSLTYKTGDKFGAQLSSYVDAEGRETHYSYTVKIGEYYEDELIIPPIGPFDIRYFELTTITHPTGAQTVFDYETSIRNHASGGIVEVFKLRSRKDKLGTAVYNELLYEYSENDCSGYPVLGYVDNIYDWFKYHTIVKDTVTGLETKYIFGDENTCEKVESSCGETLLSRTSYDYYSFGKPQMTQTELYNDYSDTPFVSAQYRYYNFYGDITSSWSFYEENAGSSNDIYKTTYTYDSTYHIPLTQTYKTDAETTVKIVNTLTSDGLDVASTETYVNDVLTARTDYFYDSHGNVVEVRKYHDNFTDYDSTEYEYENNAYLKKEIHRAVFNADNTPAVSTAGETGATVATVYSYDILGRLISMTDPSGNTYSYEYDNLGNLTNTTNPDDTEIFYTRNYTQNTLTVTDENGNSVKYTYTPLGLEYETIDVASGKVLTRKEYDASSRLIKVSEYLYGGVTTYTYDALGRVTSEKKWQGDALLSEVNTEYDDAYDNGTYQKVTQTIVGETGSPSIKITKYVDKHGNTVRMGCVSNGVEYFDTHTYDYIGRVVSSLSAADSAKDLDYTVRYVYNENGQAVRTYNSAGQYTENTYNAISQLVASSDYAGNETVFEYDVLGRLIKQTYPITSNESASLIYEYDANGNIITELKPINAVGETDEWSRTEYTYDSRNRLISAVQYDGESSAMTTEYMYDNVGNTLTVTVGEDSTTSYTYDRFGNVLTMTDSAGESETYTYTELGRLVTKTDRNGSQIHYEFDALGRNTITYALAGTELSVNYSSYYKTGALKESASESQLTEYIYNDLGQAVQVTESECEFEISSIPGYHRVTLDANGGEITISSVIVTEGGEYSLPTPTRQYYDFIGWLYNGSIINNGDTVEITEDCTFVAQWVIVEEPVQYHTITLDANGGTVSPSMVTVAEGSTYSLPTPTRQYYDFIGWQYNGTIINNGDTVEITEDCTFVAQWTVSITPTQYHTITLNANGGKVARTSVRVKNEDTISLPVPMHDSYVFGGWFYQGQEIANGDVAQFTENLTLTARWVGLDFKIEYHNVSPDGTGMIWDPANTNIQWCHRNELTTLAENCFTYPSTSSGDYELMAVRPQMSFAGWSTTPNGQVVYTNGESGIDFGDELINTDAIHLYTVWTSSSGGGNVSLMSYAAPVMLMSVSDELVYVKTYAYDLAGNITAFTVTEDGEVIQSVSYTYDNLNRLTKVSENGIEKATYTYDTNGNRASLAYDNGVTTNYTYNLANWVTGLYNKKGSTVISSYEYTYYASGNRKSETDASGKVTSYTYDDLNRIVTESDVDNTITYTYDGRGNRTKRVVTGLDAGTTVYIYDSNNRLTYESTSTPMLGVSLTAYEYDKNGNNTAKVCSGERFEYVYDAFGKLKRYITNDDIAIYAYNSSGIRTLKWVDGTTTKYILNGGDVVGEVSDGETTTTYLRGINLICTDEYYYVFDAHGDVVNLTDANGNTIKTYEYDAFGVEKNPDDSDTNPFRYCGEYWDSETETYYLRARSYDPNLGRFGCEDPIGAGLNWYTYCGNNPIMFIDPYGLERIVVSGGRYSTGSGFQYEFIETAVKQIKDWIYEGDEKISWIIADEGWSDSDKENFSKTAKDLDINLVYITDKEQLFKYINNGQDRSIDPITAFTVFSHGFDRDDGVISLGYNYSSEYNTKLDIYKSDIENINTSSFKNPISKFYSCNTGTSGDGSFAQMWVNAFGGQTTAFVGRSDYSYINIGAGLWVKFLRKLDRWKYGFSPAGSYNYPVAASDANIQVFKKK